MASRPRLYPPRWQTPLPPGVNGTFGGYVVDYARDELGIVLDRWQVLGLNRALATIDGELVHRHYLLSTARQNGKTAIVRSLIGTALTSWWSLPWQGIAGVAFDRKQAMIPYRAVLADLAPMQRRVGTVARGGLSLTRYLGIRSALWGRAREYHVFSREARDAMRGESLDLPLFDEVRTQRNYELWAALEPTTTARPMPLIVATSTAGDDRSVLLRDWWERGRRIIAGDEPFTGFGMTWYAADDELAGAELGTQAFRRALKQANPAHAAGRLPYTALAGSKLGMNDAAFRSERLNLWSEGTDDRQPIPPALWDARLGPRPPVGIRVVLGVEAVPTWRRVTVIAAVATDAGVWVGVAGELDAADTDAVTVSPQAAQSLVERMAREWRPAAIAYSAAAAIAPYVAAAAATTYTEASALTPRQVRAASQLFRSELDAGRLTHEPDELMRRQSRAARSNAPIEGGDWYLSVRDSLGEIDSVRAAAWAAWAAIAPEAIGGSGIHV